MEESTRASICRIDVLQNGSTISRGSGALAANGIVLTAFHVVGDRRAKPPSVYPGQIQVRFPGFETKASLIETHCDGQGDWALLRLEKAPDVRPIPLTAAVKPGAEWAAFGFPDDNPNGFVHTGVISDERADLEGNRVLQLFCEQAAAGTGERVKGLSGGPVLIGNALAGVMRFALMRDGATVAGTLYAVPADVVAARCQDLLPMPDPYFGLPGLPATDLPQNPFRYLDRFTAADAEIFFGRGKEIREMYDLVLSKTGPRVILLYGQSGVGKSSYLDAGVVPRLSWTHRTCYLRRDKSKTLLRTLMEGITRGDQPGAGASATLERLWTDAEASSGQPMVIILDQVEEVFTQVNHLRLPELEELAAELARGFGPTSRIQGRLILSFRKEWLPEIQKILESANIETRKVFLEAIGSNAIIETVRGLTTTPRLREKYELRIDELLPMRIAGDLLADRDSPLAPTLQILLTRMWQKARERDPDRPEFTLGLFNELKKQGIVMTDFLNQQLDLVYEQQPDAARTGLAVDLLTFHTTAAGTSRQRTREEIIKAYGQPESELWGILEACSATALLTEVDGGFRLSHDTLGPVVRQKFVESQLPGQRAKRLLDAAEQDWDESETPWFEKWELAIIEQGLAGMHRIPPRQQKLLDRAREAMMIRDRRDAHHARLIRIAQGVVLLLLIGTGIAWWNAFRDKRLAELHHQFVMIDRYAWADPFAALAVAVQSAARSLKQEKLVLTELQKGLSQTYDDSREVDRIGLDSPLRALAVGAQSVLAGDNLGRVHVHRAGGVGRRSFQAHEQPITAIAASPDGTWFATADRGGSAKLWHSDADVEPSEIGAPRTGLHVTSMAAAPNGALLFSGWTDGAVDVYSVYGRRIEQKIKAACGRSSGSPPTAVSKIAATRSRQGETLLAIGCDDGRTGVWNASTRRWRRPLVTAFEDDSVSALDIVTPGQGPDFMLAAASSTGAVRVWRDGSLERGTEQQYHSSVLALRFNSRADLIAVGTQDGVLHVMYTDGTPFRSPFPGFAAAITAIAFDSESHHILASSKDGTLRSIDLEGVGAGIAVSTDDNRVTSLAFAAGDTMLVGITSENLWLWSIHRESNVHLSFARKIPRAGSEQYDTTLAISPVRPWIAYGGDHCVRLLDSTTFQELQPIQVGLPRVKSLAWSPNGDYLAIGGEGADVYLWDAKGKRLLNKANADHISTTRSLIFSPNGQYLFTTGDNGRVRRFSVVPGSGLQPSPMRCAGKQRISEGGCLETTDFHGGVYVLAYPSTGTSLLVGDAAGVVRIFYDDGEREGSRFRAHNGPVQNIRVHPDGEAIYTSSDEGVVQAHSHTTHEQLCVRLNGQAGGTFGLALTSNGSLLASGNDDGTVELWRPHWKTLAEAACQRLQQHPRFTNPDATTEGPHVFQAIQEAAAACAVKFWQNP